MPHLLPLQDLEAQALSETQPEKALEKLKHLIEGDPRQGALRLLAKFEKNLKTRDTENQRLERLWAYEKKCLAQGFTRVAGVDEVGRGPLAGPVVAAAVLFSKPEFLSGLDDSKKLTPAKREGLSCQIRNCALTFAIGEASVCEIDELNIYQATRLAMERAIKVLNPKPDYLLTDAMPLPQFSEIPQQALIHGDALSASIAAASIIAKVYRDNLMEEMDKKYPAYGFARHKGYGTLEHVKALQEAGISPEHRLSFAPVLEALSQKYAGGPVGYWREKLKGAGSLEEIKQTGILIKRIASLSSGQLEELREVYRVKRDQWPKAVS